MHKFEAYLCYNLHIVISNTYKFHRCYEISTTAAMMSAIYEENKDEDGFLYMTYSGENTFGLF